MPPREDGDQELVDDLILADDLAGDLLADQPIRLAELVQLGLFGDGGAQGRILGAGGREGGDCRLQNFRFQTIGPQKGSEIRHLKSEILRSAIPDPHRWKTGRYLNGNWRMIAAIEVP